jgi:hypothetical protein
LDDQDSVRLWDRIREMSKEEAEMSTDVPVVEKCAEKSPNLGKPGRRPVRGYAILPRPDAPYSIDPDTAGTTWRVATPDGVVLAVIYASKLIGHGAEMRIEAGGDAAGQILGLGRPRLPLTRPDEDDSPLPLGWSDVLAEVAALLEREGWVCLCDAEQLHDAYARSLLVAPLMEEHHAALARAEAAEAERDAAPFIAARDTLRAERDEAIARAEAAEAALVRTHAENASGQREGRRSRCPDEVLAHNLGVAERVGENNVVLFRWKKATREQAGRGWNGKLVLTMEISAKHEDLSDLIAFVEHGASSLADMIDEVSVLQNQRDAATARAETAEAQLAQWRAPQGEIDLLIAEVVDAMGDGEGSPGMAQQHGREALETLRAMVIRSASALENAQHRCHEAERQRDAAVARAKTSEGALAMARNESAAKMRLEHQAAQP